MILQTPKDLLLGSVFYLGLITATERKGIGVSSDFARIRAEVLQDVELNPDYYELLSDRADMIEFIDKTDGIFDYHYVITDTDVITPDWLKSKTLVTPDARELFRTDLSNLFELVDKYIPKEAYQTLQELIFITNSDADYEYLYNDSELYIRKLLEEHALPDEEQLGLSWTAEGVVIINLGKIETSVKEMTEEGAFGSTLERVVLDTIAHEFRHLQQTNPYVSQEIKDTFLDDIEIDAEVFARNINYGELGL